MNRNEIYLQKSGKVLVDAGFSNLADQTVATVMKNIESLGFIFSKPLFDRLKTLSVAQVEQFYVEIVPVLKGMVGAHVQHRPMYPNFPKQVLEMSECELYLNAIMHYWSAALQDAGLTIDTWLPEYEKEERPPLLENSKLKVIELGTKKEFDAIFTRLAASNSSISTADKEILLWFIENEQDIDRLLPEAIPFKEQLCFIAGCIIAKGIASENIVLHVKTATDVLRIATALSGGDISLAENTKFRRWTRGERKYLLRLLETCTNITEDMLRHKGKWIHLLHGLHVGDYKNRFQKAYAAASILRQDTPFATMNSKIERSIAEKDTQQIVELLKTRPGNFARRLDKILRETSSPAKVIKTFISVADKVSTPVLLQVFQHFTYREAYSPTRSVFPKGNLAKVQVLENPLPELPFTTSQLVSAQVEEVLKSRFTLLPPLGKCFIDEELKNYLVPFSQRSASKQLMTITRGSKIPFAKDKTLRFFIWWKNTEKQRVDLDLSSFFLDEDFGSAGEIAYYNLRNGKSGHHSGDITDAPKGASEFIDINISKLPETVRYIGMSVNSFSNQLYKDLPECFAGWMSRERPNSGEIFEAKTVQNKFDLTADTTIALPVLFDVKKGQAIWMDLALKKAANFSDNVHNNKGNMARMCKAITELNKLNLYDLLTLHVSARGKIVAKEKADTIFNRNFATQSDLILSDYLK